MIGLGKTGAHQFGGRAVTLESGHRGLEIPSPAS